ncbi:phenylacrylic acid decarboxylase [Aspergillus heteromorphus CBS 117.55]|uniref:Phenylacrylic acid decarboxylase n=1 Tax=Aspergillus heteromorphus CBS 117.55 TaxID=1448321 RepID=A0A317VP35_9EURO|nr:phenylacrylic acid decarboxylase [Aspergillus heteromorphus CBS 117.55]PWY75011.1 phenylacrylic acid decarboxylase [Aspergillus heteromorphus CBS 117.55]
MAASVDRQEIDRVLRQKRNQREARACYPCRQRKVKCDSALPCRTCRRRGHPQICVYDQATPGSKQARNVSQQLRPSNVELQTQPSVRSQSVPHLQQGQYYPNRISSSDGPDNELVYSGDNSVVSILRNRTQDANGSMAREVGSVLGLQNTYDSYPFMEARTPQDRWTELLRIIPQRAELLKFFHFFRLSAYPFNPILVDIERFELDVCSYLNDLAAGELQDPRRISERWATDRSVGLVSLLLATLASGAHYSDLEHIQRSELYQDFARRSFQALRLANFLFRPTMDIIQTLLIIGNTLQNNGQSDAAWALLGTTVRLAQTLGLHTERGMARFPDHVKWKARKLWFAVVWQDSLLCLCYDRPPIVSITGWTPDNSIFSRTDLCYTEVMHYLCRMALEISQSAGIEGQQSTPRLDTLASLDSVYQRAQPHLRERQECKTLHHNLEHLALKMHVSLAISVLTRSALRRIPIRDSAHDVMRTRAKNSLIDASRAFLDFQALSVVPLRSWSMVHTVLSSTLLLCIWEETRNDAECRDLQQRVIEVFSAAGSVGTVGNSASENGQWLSERHIRALITLRNAVRTAVDREKEEGDVGIERPEQPGPFFPAYGMPNGFPDDFGQDFSPASYLDSIMNVPMFDLSKEIEFL